MLAQRPRIDQHPSLLDRTNDQPIRPRLPLAMRIKLNPRALARLVRLDVHTELHPLFPGGVEHAGRVADVDCAVDDDGRGGQRAEGLGVPLLCGEGHAGPGLRQ